MGKMNKKKLSKIWPVIAIIGVMVLTIWLIYHFFGDFFATLFTILRNGDQAELTAYRNSQNEASGLLSIFLLTIRQVVSIFFPGMVIHIVAGVIYGWWKAFLACYAGFVAEVFICHCIAVADRFFMNERPDDSMTFRR